MSRETPDAHRCPAMKAGRQLKTPPRRAREIEATISLRSMSHAGRRSPHSGARTGDVRGGRGRRGGRDYDPPACPRGLQRRAGGLPSSAEAAEGIAAGTVDPHDGANRIWHTALRDVDLRPLQPFIDAGDQLDYLDRSDPARAPLEAEIVGLARELLSNTDFWAQGD